MDESLTMFIDKLKRSPAVLFLGQETLRLDSGNDMFLQAIAEKYFSGQEKTIETYKDILVKDTQGDIEAKLAWLQLRCERITVPESLKMIGRFPWNSVFSSCFDDVWHRAFEVDYRRLYSICTDSLNPPDQRNRAVLHCTYLYGCVGRGKASEVPPFDILAKVQRDMYAQNLAQRIPEIVTPLGVLAIDGYSPSSDWFTEEKFVPILSQFSKGQVHLFGTDCDWSQYPLFEKLWNMGIIIFHSESLATVLSLANSKGFLSLDLPPHLFSTNHTITLRDKLIEVPQEVWGDISKVCVLIDDQMLISPPEVSEEKRYQEFRDFLTESKIDKLCQGFARKFAFRRHFEKELYKKVEKSLEKKQLADPIFVYGASGTGKTIALGHLAFDMRRRQTAVVLFIERSSFNYSQEILDRFLNWLEDLHEECPILIIWDGMQEIKHYYNLLQFLAARGRRYTTLVGTCYTGQIPSIKGIKVPSIEAPHILSKEEVQEFKGHVMNIDPIMENLIRILPTEATEAFLVLLYRLLPVTRYGLRRGLLREVENAEALIEELASSIKCKPILGSLALALQAAGFNSKEGLFSQQIIKIAGEKKNEIQLMVDLIMVPGQFGTSIPIELLFRSLGKLFSEEVVSIISSADIIKWEEDMSGNIMLGPRQALEAQLIVVSRLGGATQEAEIACQLIVNVQDRSKFGDSHEVDFAIKLIRNMGPNGPHGDKYESGYLLLANALRELRQNRGVQNPRLILQEGNLLREYIRTNRAIQNNERSALLDRAKETLLIGVELLEGDDPGKIPMRGTLKVELASVIGSQAVEMIKKTNYSSTLVYNLYLQVKKLMDDIGSINATHHALMMDILAWTSEPLLRSIQGCDDSLWTEITDDVLYAFEALDTHSLDISIVNRLNERKLELADTIKNHTLSDQAFDALAKSGSCAGYYLRAKQKAGDILFEDSLINDEVLLRARDAFDDLQKHVEIIGSDYRCLFLQFRLWWLLQCKSRMFSGERLTFPFGDAEWQYVLKSINRLLSFPQVAQDLRLKYLYAVYLFHQRSYGPSWDAFRELELEAQNMVGSRRVLKSYLASQPSGEPIVFSGYVDRVIREHHRGLVRVKEIRQSIPFYFRDLITSEVKEGDPLPGFHIAFNFIGMIADPVIHYKKYHKI
jgi:hypothetical protein